MEDRRIIKSLGVDIGQKQDPPGMVLCERHIGRYEVRVTKTAQMPLEMPYPALVAAIEIVAEDVDILVLDGTGVGRPIYDYCRKTIPHCWAAIVTVGKNVVPNYKHQTVRVPKETLIETIVRMVEKDHLRVEPTGDYEKLMDELHNLQRTQASMRVRYGAKSGKHDDLVMALANSVLGFGLEAKMREAAA